ncbi:MAG: hypothetical protein IKU01_08245 [Bacteroidales bacterium]|nr:hypothetical protein [Bacteroidales bacterium]
MQRKRLLQFPDLKNIPAVTVLLDENQKKDIETIGQFVKNSLNPRKLRFVVLTENMVDGSLQDDCTVFIRKKDFNIFGILKKEKEVILKSFSCELFVNLSENNKNILNDYLVSCIDSSFRIGHSKNNMQLHDLVIDHGIEKKEVERMKIIYKYLLMLSGNKNEK